MARITFLTSPPDVDHNHSGWWWTFSNASQSALRTVIGWGWHMQPIAAEFQKFADDFIGGEIDALARWFEFPLAIYADAKVSVFQDWSALAEYFAFYRAELKARGATSAIANVVATPMMRSTSGTIWMSETFCGADGQEIASSQVRYFFNVLSGAPKIALVEYQQLAAFNSFEDFGVFRAT